MDFNKTIEDLLATIRQFLDIHANPYDTSKHNETAEKLTKLQEALSAKEAVVAENKAVAQPNTEKLASSVGKGGKNEKTAVVLVQTLLNKNGTGLVPDGACGPKTIAAIEKFQKAKSIPVTSLVEPDSPSFKALLGIATPVTDPVPQKEEPVKKDQPKKDQPATPTATESITSSVGKGGTNEKSAVTLVQSLLNRHGAGLGVDGDCGAKSIAAIEKFQKAKEIPVTGLVEPDSPTFKALLEKSTTVVPGEEEIVTKQGGSGKLGNTIISKSAYIVSIPPNASGSYPLVLIFSGKGGNASSLLNEVPDIYYMKAIMVFSGPSGSFAGAKGVFDPALVERGLSVSDISICGFSLGGQAAFKNYGNATKAVGLMDPTTYYKDIAKIDSKAIFVAKTRNGKNIAYGWDWSGGKPGDTAYTCQHARAEALDTAAAKGGVGEEASMDHGKFPRYLLSKYRSKFI